MNRRQHNVQLPQVLSLVFREDRFMVCDAIPKLFQLVGIVIQGAALDASIEACLQVITP